MCHRAAGMEHDDEPRETYEAIGRRIRARREALGLVTRELGARMGCNHSAIVKWEGASRRISLKELLRLARSLRVQPGALLDAPEDRPRDSGDEAADLVRQLPDDDLRRAFVAALRAQVQAVTSGGRHLRPVPALDPTEED